MSLVLFTDKLYFCFAMETAGSNRPRIVARGSTLSFAHPIVGELPLYVMSLDQEDAPVPHAHDFIELVYVRQGSGLHCHEGQAYPIFAGDAFVVAPGEYHTYESGRNLRITNILFYPGILDSFKAPLAGLPGFVRFFSIEPLFRRETSFRYKLHLGPVQQKTFVTLCDQLDQELSGSAAGFQALSLALFVQMLVYLGRCFDRSLQSTGARHDFEGKERMVAAAISFLEQKYHEDVSVADVARFSYVSASRLSHVFKSVTGMSLVDYLIKLRLDRACELLNASRKTVSEIAIELGFHDASYFGRIFRKRLHLSPSDFRKKSVPAQLPTTR